MRDGAIPVAGLVGGAEGGLRRAIEWADNDSDGGDWTDSNIVC